MSDAPGTENATQIRCPHCEAMLTVNWEDVGESVVCSRCGQPFDAAPPREPAQGGPLFHFQCLRCGSVLEARAAQSGRQCRCPSCAALFIVPERDPRTGLARRHADPGDDGENPAPVHAYAAAGDQAPRITRKPDDSLWIVCSRCHSESPIQTNTCPKCGLPFTMEGMATSSQTSGFNLEWGTVALLLGMAALPLSACGGGGVGIVPGVLAFGIGLFHWSSRGARGITAARAGVGLGVLASLTSAAILLYQ